MVPSLPGTRIAVVVVPPTERQEHFVFREVSESDADAPIVLFVGMSPRRDPIANAHSPTLAALSAQAALFQRDRRVVAMFLDIQQVHRAYLFDVTFVFFNALSSF